MKLFAELNRTQIREAAPRSLAVLPIGATEQHGPHLPTGTDLFTVESVAREAAQAASSQISLIVTPALPFGSSDHHLMYGATLSLSTETYYKVLRELLESLVTDGFGKIFVLNGHGGNHELAELAARDVALRHPVNIAAGSYWSIAWEDLVRVKAHQGRRMPGHAGDFESSVMLSLRPQLANSGWPHRDGEFSSDRLNRRPYRKETHEFWRKIDGYTDSPDQATAEKGTLFRSVIVKAVAQAFTDFYSS